MSLRKELKRHRERWGRSYRKRRLNLARWLLRRSWVREAIALPAATDASFAAAGRRLKNSEGLPAPLPFDTDLALKPGICVVGYLRSEIGLGQAARCLAYAADAARVPSSFYHLPLPSRENDAEFATKCISVPDRKASLLVFGLPSITTLYGEIGGGRHNILYPFWELHGIEREWLQLAERCSELWAPSTFVADAFREQSKLPVTLLRQPVPFPKLVPSEGERSGPLTFLTYFDYDSFGARKNPKATVEAFRRAFPQGSEDVKLIVKTRGVDDNGLRTWLARQAVAEGRLDVIDRTVDRATMDRLVAECDVFVSLHRSEGFGFGAAEALAASKAVIATDYSGTTDFIDETTGYPIAYKLIPVEKGQYLAPAGQVWADADLDHAAAAMRTIYDQPDQARLKAERGRQRLLAEFSPAVIGAQMRSLLADRGLI